MIKMCAVCWSSFEANNSNHRTGKYCSKRCAMQKNNWYCGWEGANNRMFTDEEINKCKTGKLYGTKCYLIGAMDRVADNGVGWREDIIPFMIDRGIVALNPCDKPISIGLEGAEDRKNRQKLKDEGNYNQLNKEIKLLRVVDLRMTDMSDFIICNVDTSVHMCGTYEEMSWANRLKRPILIHCEQGRKGLPDWIFGMLPNEFIFDTWGELKNYIDEVDSGRDTRHFKRWMFFDYWRLTPEGQRQYYLEKEAKNAVH